jgi:uncharacterized protein YndB with AHSA1/START domain
MLKKIVIGLAVTLAAIVIIFVLVVAMQPSEFRIVRTASMAAPASAVFAEVNDFHRWQAWSPWAKLDPDAKNSFEGPPAGVGAIFRWSGNGDVGEGSLTIKESRPNELIRLVLDFKKPMEDTSDTEFTFEPDGGGTKVTWTMSGKNNFVAKAVCLFMDMEEMVGGRFVEGLANIKAIVEARR